MPEFILDTSGRVQIDAAPFQGATLAFEGLDDFTQGHIEALFFADCDEPGIMFAGDGEDRSEPVAVGFSDLAPEALASIIDDCREFQASDVWKDWLHELESGMSEGPDEAQAGRDFWYTRNGHGCGFWDGDWPEPYGAELTKASKAFGECDAYLGDDGKVYLS